MRTTNIRFTGLASGLDTESLVQSMVMPYKMNMDAAIQEQKLLELKKDAWKEMNTKIFSFYNDTLSDLRLESSFDQKELSVSQTGIVEIETNGSFPDGTHTIKDVTLAEGAVVSTQAINKEGSTKLSELGINFADGEAHDLTINVNGETKTITLTGDMTLDGLAKEFKNAGVSANYDSGAGAFFISSKETGGSQSIEIGGDAAVLEKLGISSEKAVGASASLTYNGVKVSSETNTVTVNGMTIKLTGETKEGQEITVVSKADVTATKEMIVGFVEKYNALIEEMNTKVNAAYNKDYLPLTDEQKADMTDEDIELWNEKVEASLLRKDPVLQAITESMRGILSDVTVEGSDGKTYSLASFGITTSMNYKEGGKLVVDEEKLDEMLAQKPDVFKELFTRRSDNMEDSGIGTRLYDDISQRLKGSDMKSSNFLFNDKYLNDLIDDQEDEVEKLEDRMYTMENLYYSQFSAMEQMISDLNNQSSWLAGQLGGM